MWKLNNIIPVLIIVALTNVVFANILSLSEPMSRSSSSYEEEESVNFSPEEAQAGLPRSRTESSSTSTSQFTQDENLQGRNESLNLNACSKIEAFKPTFDAIDVFPNLGFHAPWIRRKWFWLSQDFDFEGRFRSRFKSGTPPPEITVFVIPHSHSDPGWLKTFDGYFFSQTKYTLDFAVEKLMLYPNMTFIWNEVSFLSKWWSFAKTDQRTDFIQLVKEGRLEILTGGWVMQDEATVNLYAMIDQLIEGRQWVKANLGITPNVSWSIDPFGHGSTLPYILKTAKINHMVIQRLHYAWKKYFGEKQYGNFEWVQRWDTRKEHSITCHNAPYDLYTTKHTCGPDPQVCVKYDFRNIFGEYSEYMKNTKPVTPFNVEELASDLVEQFRKTASLQPHNIVMFPLGDDFRFDKGEEWDQQYENYVKLINYINQNHPTYKTNIRFGTVSNYFEAIETTPLTLPTFSGDFFPYADVFASATPAYWTGYYGTRPYWKKFYRETENNMRSAEILFTLASNLARQKNDTMWNVVLTQEYDNLVRSRRNLALFAHHDGTTGTSRRITMDDYGRRLHDASKSSLNIQRQALKAVFVNTLNITVNTLGLDFQQENFGDIPAKIARVIYQETDRIVKKVVIFNSLGWKRVHLARVLVTSNLITVHGPHGVPLLSQINPVVEFDTEGQMSYRKKVYELVFLAELPPLGFSVYEIRKAATDSVNLASIPYVFCKGCLSSSNDVNDEKIFDTQNITSPTIVLGNGKIDAQFDATTGLLRKITKIRKNMEITSQLSFGGYKSYFRDSGAYLLKVDTSDLNRIQIPFEESQPKIIVVEGPILSYISAFSAPLKITTKIIKSDDQFPDNEAIFQENIIDLGTVAAEVYMRFSTNLNSTTTTSTSTATPTFYTDQSGFTMEKRVKVPWIGYEGNQYPVNNVAYIQDDRDRFSVLVDRAHGFSSMEPGRLETLIERRTIYDDGRGMAEGVTDNRRTVSNYVLLLEKLDKNQGDPSSYSSNNLLTIESHHLSTQLNFPPTIFVYDDLLDGFLGSYSFLTKPLPQNTHLINFRTISSMSHPHHRLEQLPTSKSLLITHSFGFYDNNCTRTEGSLLFFNDTRFDNLNVDYMGITDLAGVSSTTKRVSPSLTEIKTKPFTINTIFIQFKHSSSFLNRQ